MTRPALRGAAGCFLGLVLWLGPTARAEEPAAAPPAPAESVEDDTIALPSDDAAPAPEGADDDADKVVDVPAQAEKTSDAAAKPANADPATAAKAEPKADAKAEPKADPKAAKTEKKAAVAPPTEHKDSGGLVEVAPDTWTGGVSATGEPVEPGLAPKASSSLLDELYKDREDAFQLRPPAGWKPVPSASGYAAAFRGPAVEGFLPLLTVEIQRQGGQPNIESTVAERKKHNAVDLSNYHLVLEHYSKTHGSPAAVLSGTFFADNFRLRNYQVIVDEGPTKYVLTYVTIESEFEPNRKVFRESALTFDWTDARGAKPSAARAPAESFVTVE